jgi:hypothetical protein
MSRCPEDQRRRAIAAAIATGNVSGAARDHGVSRTQLHAWLKDAKSPEVTSVRNASAKFHAEVMTMLRATMRKLRARVRSEKLSAPGLASVASVLSAIAKAWAPRRDPLEAENGDWVIQVRRGGARVSSGMVDEHGMVIPAERVDDEPNDKETPP